MRQDVGVDGDAQRLSQLCWMFFLKIIDDQDQQLEIMQDNYRSPIPERFQWRTWAADAEGITGDALLFFINTELFPALKKLPVTGKNTNRARVVRSVFEDAYNYMKSGQLMRQVINKISGVDFNDLAERKHFGDIYEQLLNDLQSAGNAGEYYTPRAVTAFMVDRIDPKPGESLFDPSCGTGGFLTCAIRHMRERYVKKVEDEQALQAGLRAVEKKQLPHMLCVTNMLLHGIEDPSFVRHDNTLARPYISYGQSDRVDIILTNPPFGGREEDGIESNFPAHFRTKETADLFLALFIRLLRSGGRAAVVLPDGSLFGEGVKTRLKEALLEECNLHTVVRLPNSVFKPYASIGTNLLFFEKGEPTKEVWFYEHRVPAGQQAYSMTKPMKLEHLRGCVEWWGGFSRENRQETEQAWKVSIEEIKSRGYNLDFKNPHVAQSDHGDTKTMLAELIASEQKITAIREQLKAILAEDFLLERFELFANHPGNVPLLRRYIVDLAVRGKLFPETEQNISATEMLNRIAAKAESLIKQGQLKKSKPLPAIGVDELPPAYAAHCQFERLGNVANLKKGLTGIQGAARGEFPLVVTAAARSTCDHYDFDGAATIIPMVSSTGHGHASLNRLHYQEGKFALGTILCAVFPIDEELLSARFIFEYLTAFKDELLVSRMNGTANVTLTVNKIAEVPVPLIAPAVQRRIEELMSLCDQLEVQLAATEADSRRLLEAVLRKAIESDAVTE